MTSCILLAQSYSFDLYVKRMYFVHNNMPFYLCVTINYTEQLLKGVKIILWKENYFKRLKYMKKKWLLPMIGLQLFSHHQ